MNYFCPRWMIQRGQNYAPFSPPAHPALLKPACQPGTAARRPRSPARHRCRDHGAVCACRRPPPLPRAAGPPSAAHTQETRALARRSRARPALPATRRSSMLLRGRCAHNEADHVARSAPPCATVLRRDETRLEPAPSARPRAGRPRALSRRRRNTPGLSKRARSRVRVRYITYRATSCRPMTWPRDHRRLPGAPPQAGAHSTGLTRRSGARPTNQSSPRHPFAHVARPTAPAARQLAPRDTAPAAQAVAHPPPARVSGTVPSGDVGKHGKLRYRSTTVYRSQLLCATGELEAMYVQIGVYSAHHQQLATAIAQFSRHICRCTVPYSTGMTAAPDRGYDGCASAVHSPRRPASAGPRRGHGTACT